MDLQEPTNKMSKSVDSHAGTVLLTEDLGSVAKKFKRAVTDSDGEVRYDVAAKPGVSNLLSILGAATGRTPEEVAEEYSQYGPLKSDTAEAVVELLRADPGSPRRPAGRSGRDRPTARPSAPTRPARSASGVLARAVANIGLLPAG